MYLNYIHRVRAIAIICIVSGHCMRFFDWSHNPQTERICKSTVEDGVVLFVLISGFLFQHLLHKYKYKKYIVNKIKNIILPYFFISIPMIIYLVFVERQGHWAFPELNVKPYYYQILWFYIKGKQLAPFWFIPMISIFYLLFPVLELIDRNSKCYFFIVPVGIIIAALIHRPPAEINLTQMSFHFLPVYIFGMFLSHYKKTILKAVDGAVWWFIFIFALLYFTELYFYHNVGIIYVQNIAFHDKELIDINLFQKIVLCLLLISFFRKYNSKLKNNFAGNVLGMIGGLSFGIFLIHYYLLEAIFRTQRIFHYKIEGDIFPLAVFSTSVIIICIVILKISKLMLRSKSRYFIGC